MKCKIALLAIIIALIFIGSELVIAASVSAPEEEWEKTFGDSNRDEDYSVQQTKDGGYIIAGFTESYVLVHGMYG